MQYRISDRRTAVTTILRNIFSTTTPVTSRRYIQFPRARVFIGATSDQVNSLITVKIGGRPLVDRVLLSNVTRFPILDPTTADLLNRVGYRAVKNEEIEVDIESGTSAIIWVVCDVYAA